MDSERVIIPGSELKPGVDERALSAAVPSQQVTVTIVLRRNPKAGGPSEQDLLSGRYQASGQTGAAARAAMAADPDDVAKVRSFAAQYGLKVVEEDTASRTVQVQAPVSTMDKAFGVQLRQSADSEENSYLTYRGSISVPKPLAGVVIAVLGLDQRPVAAPRHQ